jgi:hypothetical protein
MRSRVHFAIVGMLLFCAIAMQAHAATITVTNTNDSGSGSLRQALTVANDGDTITFAVTGTITLTSGGLPITKNLTISGPGADQLSIDGNQALLVLGIFPDKTAAISGLTVRNGQLGIWNEGTSTTVSDCVVSGNVYYGLVNDYVLSVSNCTVSGNSGGGIYNDHATLIVTDCVVTANSYGGIYDNESHGPTLSPSQHGNNRSGAKKMYDDPLGYVSATITNSIISDNSGSGVYNDSGNITITNSTISGNSVSNTGGQFGEGGGIYTRGEKLPGNVTVTNSTISGNFAFYDGGGISSGFSGLTISNSTISGNSTGDPDYGYGGGVAASSVTIMNSTISDNSASYSGAGISAGGGTIGNAILNNNSGGNIDGAITSLGYNVSSDDGGGLLNGPGDQINTDPLLGPLQDNGGPTLTHLPLPGSPAIDAGDPNFTSPPLRDQRGVCFYRVFGRRVDVGSVETQPEPRCPSPAPRPTP